MRPYLREKFRKPVRNIRGPGSSFKFMLNVELKRNRQSGRVFPTLCKGGKLLPDENEYRALANSVKVSSKDDPSVFIVQREIFISQSISIVKCEIFWQQVTIYGWIQTLGCSKNSRAHEYCQCERSRILVGMTMSWPLEQTKGWLPPVTASRPSSFHGQGGSKRPQACVYGTRMQQNLLIQYH